ncbi:MAG: ArdC-like ssDNA-binding domain-containing protein [Solirubrobacteraceae bacterium]|jgi:antirestriction protein ArdC
MSKTTKRLTDEQRAQRRRADREFACEAVERLRSSEGWQTWLAARRHFHHYSFGNQLLIAMQRPTATRVAGFRAWLKLGYAVNRGEKAIRIWVPMPPTRRQLEQWQQQGGDPDARPRTFFKLGPVFDRDQVAPLPPPATPAPLDLEIHEMTGDDLAPALPSLIALAGEIGSAVEFEAIQGSRRGYYEINTRRIAIRQDMAANAQVKTLIHELAHALLRAEPSADDPELERAAEELVVESIAYTVCGALGLDASSYSIPYLTCWSADTDIAILEHTAALTDRLARRIETAIIPDETSSPRNHHRGAAELASAAAA